MMKAFRSRNKDLGLRKWPVLLFDNKIIMINQKNIYFFGLMLSCVHIFLYLCNLKN